MIASASDSGVQLAVKTTFCQHSGEAASNKRLYLVATTRKLREVLTRAAHASGCEVVTLKRFDDLEQAGLAEVGVLVVEAAALQSEEQREHLRRLSSTHNTLVFNESFDSTVVERLRGNLDQIGMESGAGLYVLLSRAAQVIVNVASVACTEVISFFDLQWPIAQPGVRAFHYFEEPGGEG
jgi:hypothetical protein